MKKLISFLIFAFTISSPIFGQQIFSGSNWKVTLNDFGHITSYTSDLNPDFEAIQFREDEFSGPSFEGISLSQSPELPLNFTGSKNDIQYQIQYSEENDLLAVTSTITNLSDSYYLPDFERLYFGLNTSMETYPEWNNKFFPTMLRAEKTHFTGYAMSPLGRVLAFASPDPLASWNYHYGPADWRAPLESILDGTNAQRNGHRIKTVSFDLLHKLPLPERHPTHLIGLEPGESVKFKMYLKELTSLEDLNAFFHQTTGAPVFELDSYTIPAMERFYGKVYADDSPKLTVYGPQNTVETLIPVEESKGVYTYDFIADQGTGYYRVEAINSKGKVSEALVFCRESWSWYLNQARHVALKIRPTETPNAESWLYLNTLMLASKHLPDTRLDSMSNNLFNDHISKIFDPVTMTPASDLWRIQNAAMMVGVFADRYEVTNDEQDIIYAAGLVDFLVDCQMPDGGYYYLREPRKLYTAVIYIAKSIMEYLAVIEPLVEDSDKWRNIYVRHSESVKKAIDNLSVLKDNIQTEGMATFEDGMISCSATQLALGALWTSNDEKREEYLKNAQLLTDKHRSLTLLKIPDSRMYGSTLRFWEAQFTVNLMHGMMNSPSGWSAWKTYGIWYQYLLTGDPEQLKLAFESLGTFMQLIDHDSGELQFCFSVDPYIETVQFLEEPQGSGKPVPKDVVVGEQYIDRISTWHQYPYPTWREKWGIDNFVFEVFKCMEEIALTNAYLIETSSGRFDCYNCEIEKEGEELRVIADDDLIERLHVNLKNTYSVSFESKKKFSDSEITGMRWIGGAPEIVSEHKLFD